MVKKFWKSISVIGIREDTDEREARRITLINHYTFIAFLVYLVNGVTDVMFGLLPEAAFLFTSSVIFLAGLYFNKHHHHRVSIILIFIFAAFTIFYFGTLTSVQAGDYLYYFPLILAISFVLDFEKDRRIMFGLFVFIVCLIILHTYAYRHMPASEMVDEDMRYRMFVVNLTVSSAAVGFFIFLTIKDTRMISNLYEQRLKDREISEATIKRTLAEKEVLLAELHHRVKNNLAVIVSFFNLKLNSTMNDEARGVLQESRNHVNAMALVHNRLYNTGDFSEINFSRYVAELIKEIQDSYPALAGSVKVQSHIPDVGLGLDIAMPCALILNELLTNCYKHAFKATGLGRITIEMVTLSNERLQLSVCDNGVGLKEGYDDKDTLGIGVVKALAEQLNGSYEFYNAGGACFKMVFEKV